MEWISIILFFLVCDKCEGVICGVNVICDVIGNCVCDCGF